jgi:transketolase
MQPRPYSIIEIKRKAAEIRISILDAIFSASKGHIGGAFSCNDILVVLYYAGFLKVDPNKPLWAERDRFLLSKGHAGVGLYAILADLGFFSVSELNNLNQGSMFGEHPHHHVPGIEVVSGSLGHGLPIATGMAIADKLDHKDRQTVVLMGDGECYEGSVWEAANFASHHKLHNLWAIVDRNSLIACGSTEVINKLEPFADKWASFDWDVFEVDAHNIEELVALFLNLKKRNNGSPVLIIASSVKGKGVSFFENQSSWHHGGISGENYEKARIELMNTLNEYGQN